MEIERKNYKKKSIIKYLFIDRIVKPWTTQRFPTYTALQFNLTKETFNTSWSLLLQHISIYKWKLQGSRGSLSLERLRRDSSPWSYGLHRQAKTWHEIQWEQEIEDTHWRHPDCQMKAQTRKGNHGSVAEQDSFYPCHNTIQIKMVKISVRKLITIMTERNQS